MKYGIQKTVLAGCVALIACFVPIVEIVAQDAFERLLQRVEKIPAQMNSDDSCQVPSLLQEPLPVTPASYGSLIDVAQQLGDDAPVFDSDFSKRESMHLDPRVFFPQPIGRNLNEQNTIPQSQLPEGEYVYDGDDQGRRVTVDKTWNVYGLDVEDTIGHFDTVDGRRLVSPSNRVAIYAPRFSAVRKVSELGESYAATTPRQFEDERQTLSASGADLADTTKQFEQPERFKGANRISSLRDHTRGVTADATIHLFGVRNSYSPFENLEIIRFGRFSNAESARLNIGMQSASVWEDDLGLQVIVDKVQPVIAKDVKRIQQIEAIESDEDNNILRVVKIASTIAARPGDVVEFTIRFDNISSKKIGNVTIIDNLTSRLEYVPNSAESTHHADFVTKPNTVGSLKLRWEIRDPIQPGEGGIVRFKCKVR